MSKFVKVTIRAPRECVFWEGEMMIGKNSEVVRMVSTFCASSGLLLASPLRVVGSAAAVGEDVPSWWTLEGRTFSGEPVSVDVKRA